MTRQKVVLIGAGSVNFTQVLVADFARTCPADGLRLALVDTNPDALDVSAKLVRRMVELLGADIEVDASTNRRDVLAGAGEVITTISVGGRRAWESDVFIPRKYGVFQSVGDTAMPGGISRAARMIPALVAIANDVKTLCPDALFFNYANPMSANCLAIRRATGVPVIGLCHGTFRTERYLADLAGIPEDKSKRVTSLGIGINHFTFILDLRDEGVDLFPSIRQQLSEQARTSQLTHPFSWELFQRWGAYPAPGDRHVVEFMPERFPGGHYYGKTLGVDAFSFEQAVPSAIAATSSRSIKRLEKFRSIKRPSPKPRRLKASSSRAWSTLSGTTAARSSTSTRPMTARALSSRPTPCWSYPPSPPAGASAQCRLVRSRSALLPS